MKNSMSAIEQNEIFTGNRGARFQKLIRGLLKRGKLSEKNLDLYTNEESMKVYAQAFTAASADEDVNYEMYEQLGDVTANKFIVWYMYRRFPQLKHPLGVKVVARLRINYGARQTFSQLGERLGFWDFISASVEDRGRKKKDLLEDCVESFIGATEMLIDMNSSIGVGNAVAYNILKSVFDEIDISLEYEDLYDAKTRIKELFDFNKDTLGKLKYESTRDEETGIFISNAVIEYRPGMRRDLVGVAGYGSAMKMKDAEQKAAAFALAHLNRNGFVKPKPKEYAYFNDNK
jgi:dsRNA-specific ribonuclease